MSQTSKENLRKKYLEKRADLSDHEIDLMSAKLAEGFREYLSEHPLSTLHIFLPIRKFNEIDTWQIISMLQNEWPRVKLIIPRMNPDNQTLSNYIFDPDKLEKNKWGILEPTQESILVNDSEIDAVIIPLLAFDEEGARVGYGKAFYDRFLSGCRKDVLKVGLSFFEPEQQIVTDPWDVLLDVCITPDTIYSFN